MMIPNIQGEHRPQKEARIFSLSLSLRTLPSVIARLADLVRTVHRASISWPLSANIA